MRELHRKPKFSRFALFAAKTERQKDRKTERQKYKKTERQKDRKIEKRL